jgi:hypothetical protein
MYCCKNTLLLAFAETIPGYRWLCEWSPFFQQLHFQSLSADHLMLIGE